MYRAAALILRQGVISLERNDVLKNIYTSGDNKVYPLAHIDRESLEIGHYWTLKCVSSEKLFCSKTAKKSDINEFMGHASLKKKKLTVYQK